MAHLRHHSGRRLRGESPALKPRSYPIADFQTIIAVRMSAYNADQLILKKYAEETVLFVMSTDQLFRIRAGKG